MKKKSFKCKNEVGRQHTTFTSCQNAACSNEFFLWRVDYTSEGKRFDSANVIFAVYFILRGEMQCSSLPLNKGFRLFNFLQTDSGFRIIVSDFLLVRECDGFL